jgi:coenzyme F420-reducing hydrogenase beta subunit
MEKEILDKHLKRSKEGFSALQKFVIDQKACGYCGSCVSVCPSGSIEMGEENPQLVGECNQCGVCYLACPRTFLPMTDMQKWLFKSEEIPPLGSYTKAVLVGSTSEQILDRAPDGGVVTTIFKHLLDNNVVDAVITTGKQHDCSWCYHPRPMVVTDSQDLLEAIDKKYDPNPLLTVLKETTAFEKVAFVGLACHVLALKKLQYAAHAYQEAFPSFSKIARKLTGNIDFIIGLGCICRFGKGKMDVMLKEYGVSGEVQVEKHIEERVSADFVFTLKDGGEVRIPQKKVIEYPHHLCFLCCDFDGYFSDLTVDRSEYQAYNTLLTRNEKAEDILSQCLEKNLLKTRELPDEGRDFLEAMIPMLETFVDYDLYGYEHYLKNGEFQLDPSSQQLFENQGTRRVRGLPENMFMELLKKYPLFEFARKKRKELGYENPDIF